MQTGWEGQKNQLRCFFSFIYFPSSSVKKKEAVSISLLSSFLWGCGVFFELLDFFFPSQTVFPSCSVYYTEHRKGWKGMNLGRETKARSQLCSQLPCSILTGNKKTCHADTYSWKLGLPCTVASKKAFHCIPSHRLPLRCALHEHSTAYWHRYKNILWTADSSGKL